MNVVILNDYGNIRGGATKVAIDEAIELARQGVSVIYFCAVGPVSNELTNSNVNVICLNQHDLLGNPRKHIAMLQAIWNLKASRKLRETISMLDRSDTVVHLHGWTKALSSSIVRTAWKMGFKVVYTYHDFFSYCPNGGLYNYKTSKCCDLVPMSTRCILTNCDSRNYFIKLYRVLRQFVQTHIGGMTSKIHSCISISAVTDKYLKQMKTSLIVHQLRNAIDLPEIAISAPKNRDYYLYIGRVSPEKGVDIFCESCEKLGVDGVVVGDGSLKKEYESKYPSISFTGWLDGEDIVKYIQSAKILVFPSRWYETFGLTVYEALYMGVPCLVASHTAAADAIIDRVNGYKFKNKDELEARIIQIENNPELLDHLRRETLRSSQKLDLSIKSHVIRLREIYAKILSEGSVH